MTDDEQYPRFYVQGETVRGEPRVYWVVDRYKSRLSSAVSARTTDKRQADRWCAKLARATMTTGHSTEGSG